MVKPIAKFSFMEEFDKIEIQHICSNICSGGTPKSTVMEYYGGNIPWLNTKEINFSRIYDTEKKITEEGFNNSSAKWIPENSVIVAMYGATAGKTAIAKIPLTTNQACCNLTINSNKADYRFVYYALCNDYAYLASLANGGAQQNLNAQQIKEFEIPYPPLDEQKRIADILSSLDDKIELNRRINDNLEQQAQALFKAWFVDFEPWQGVMPDDWREGSIYEIVDVIYGAPYKSNLFNEKKEGLPLIRIRDLKDYSPQYYTPEILPNTEFVCMGDVIAGMDAEFIPTLWMGNKGVLNQRCCKFKSKNPKFSNYYIMYLLKPELEFVQSYKTGTTVSHLGKSDIDRFIVVIPSSDVIEDFSRKVEPLLSEKIKICKEMRILSSLRDTLLPKLMSGELKINDLNR